MWEVCLAAAVYIATIKVGVFGNLWVIGSVLHNRAPRNGVTHMSPGERLRSYIFVLALVDLLLVATLITRVFFICLPQLLLEISTCRAIFFVDYFVKLASMLCLVCISVERYIAIRKPFNSQIRKRFFKLTPVVAVCVQLLLLSALALGTDAVTPSYDRRDCRPTSEPSGMASAAGALIAGAFVVLLAVVSVNYGQIVRHVRRKFWKRKARVCGNARQHQPLVSEPRYMREMTSAIMRVAVFHVICWLPFCVFQLIPDEISSTISTSVRIFGTPLREPYWLNWAAFIANWLPYANSAFDWVFYAVLNRDFRNIIRRNTERRKRSTLSQHSSPGGLHHSLRHQVSNGLRFLQSVNGSKSAPGSFDDNTQINIGDSQHLQSSQIVGSPPSPKFSNSSGECGACQNPSPSPRYVSVSSQRSSLLGGDGLERFV